MAIIYVTHDWNEADVRALKVDDESEADLVVYITSGRAPDDDDGA